MGIIKDATKIIDARVTDIVFNAGTLEESFGVIEEGDCEVGATAEVINEITGEKHQRGYNCTVKITSLQFYDVDKFAALKNKRVWIGLNGIGIVLKDVKVNVSFTGKADAANKWKVVVEGSKYVKDLSSFVLTNSSSTGSMVGQIPS